MDQYVKRYGYKKIIPKEINNSNIIPKSVPVSYKSIKYFNLASDILKKIILKFRLDMILNKLVKRNNFSLKINTIRRLLINKINKYELKIKTILERWKLVTYKISFSRDMSKITIINIFTKYNEGMKKRILLRVFEIWKNNIFNIIRLEKNEILRLEFINMRKVKLLRILNTNYIKVVSKYFLKWMRKNYSIDQLYRDIIIKQNNPIFDNNTKILIANENFKKLFKKNTASLIISSLSYLLKTKFQEQIDLKEILMKIKLSNHINNINNIRSYSFKSYIGNFFNSINNYIDDDELYSEILKFGDNNCIFNGKRNDLFQLKKEALKNFNMNKKIDTSENNLVSMKIDNKEGNQQRNNMIYSEDELENSITNDMINKTKDQSSNTKQINNINDKEYSKENSILNHQKLTEPVNKVDHVHKEENLIISNNKDLNNSEEISRVQGNKNKIEKDIISYIDEKPESPTRINLDNIEQNIKIPSIKNENHVQIQTVKANNFSNYSEPIKRVKFNDNPIDEIITYFKNCEILSDSLKSELISNNSIMNLETEPVKREIINYNINNNSIYAKVSGPVKQSINFNTNYDFQSEPDRREIINYDSNTEKSLKPIKNLITNDIIKDDKTISYVNYQIKSEPIIKEVDNIYISSKITSNSNYKNKYEPVRRVIANETFNDVKHSEKVQRVLANSSINQETTIPYTNKFFNINNNIKNPINYYSNNQIKDNPRNLINYNKSNVDSFANTQIVSNYSETKITHKV